MLNIGEFQTNVIKIVGISLLISVIIFSIMIFFINREEKFPPVIADCPDYWITSKLFDNDNNLNIIENGHVRREVKKMNLSNNSESQCVNVKNLGSKYCSKIMNFNNIPYSSTDGNCAKYKWATSCDLTWDGITNNNSVCDNYNDRNY